MIRVLWVNTLFYFILFLSTIRPKLKELILRVPKHFLDLKTGYLEEHLDFFALYENMSDNQIRIYTIEVHNDVAGQFQF